MLFCGIAIRTMRIRHRAASRQLARHGTAVASHQTGIFCMASTSMVDANPLVTAAKMMATVGVSQPACSYSNGRATMAGPMMLLRLSS